MEIRRLESAVGAELLTRTSRRVALTPAGAALRAEATRILIDVERIADRVRAAAAGEAGTVALGAQGAALMTLVPPAVALLAQRSPALHLEVRQLASEEQLAALQEGRLDLGLVRTVHERPGIRLSDLYAEPVMAVLPSGHRLAGAQSIALAALAEERFVLWRREGAPLYFDRLIAACHDAGFSPAIAHEVRGIDARLSYVAAGLGVGLEAAGYGVLRREGVVFVALAATPVTTTVQLASADRAAPSRARDGVAGALREVAGRR